MANLDRDLKRARLYDDVADAYDRVSLPLLFAAPGRVLAGRVAPLPGSRILDVGAGTGAVARALRAAAGHSALVVLADASPAMLRAAQRAGFDACVNAMLPLLPFPTDSFDVVTAAFVLTHLDDAGAAAREMVRVLRPGGRIGLSAWYPADDDAAREWSRIVRTFIDPSRLEAALRTTLPGDARFARSGSLAELLAEAGCTDISSSDHHVECAMTVDEYITTREVAATGRAVRTLLPHPEYALMREAVRSALRARHGDQVCFLRGFHSTVARRP